MSDVSQGPGWWIASDGKWYAPELHPAYRPPPPPPPPPSPPRATTPTAATTPPAAVASPVRPVIKASKKRQIKHPKRVVGWSVAIIVVLFIVISGVTSGSPKPGPKPTPKPKPKPIATDTWTFTPLSSAVDRVFVTVKDLSKTTAVTPSCTVQLIDPANEAVGTNAFTATGTLHAGGIRNYALDVTVTNNSAQGVTHGASSVSCSY